jgi:transcriptional regulator with XRE-family HTH domain
MKGDNFMNQDKIGKFIAEKRKEKNLTQQQLAEKLGVSDRSISNWENGKNMPDLSLFKPLCDELCISINDLMSGEQIDEKNYINTLEENIVNMVSDLKNKKKQKKTKLIIILSIICAIFIVLICFYNYYEIDVKYDNKVMSCNISDKELNYSIKGQSVLNTNYIIKEINGEQIYFFHSTVNIYNKKRSNWEYSQTMANLLNNENIVFGYNLTLDTNSNDIKVYYTDSSLNKIKKLNEKELKKIINKSYLMCQN